MFLDILILVPPSQYLGLRITGGRLSQLSQSDLWQRTVVPSSWHLLLHSWLTPGVGSQSVLGSTMRLLKYSEVRIWIGSLHLSGALQVVVLHIKACEPAPCPAPWVPAGSDGLSHKDSWERDFVWTVKDEQDLG